MPRGDIEGALIPLDVNRALTRRPDDGESCRHDLFSPRIVELVERRTAPESRDERRGCRRRRD
jgi:hypothetical protein